MEFTEIIEVISGIDGCTFASIDTDTITKEQVRRITEGESIILFTNKFTSGYENMVRRRLKEAGLDPDTFVLSPSLPWGDRVEGTPLIYHQGQYYLQTILLREGKSRCFIGPREIECASVKSRRSPDYRTNLPEDRRVVVRTYKLENITAIRLKGSLIESANRRPILTLNGFEKLKPIE